MAGVARLDARHDLQAASLAQSAESAAHRLAESDPDLPDPAGHVQLHDVSVPDLWRPGCLLHDSGGLGARNARLLDDHRARPGRPAAGELPHRQHLVSRRPGSGCVLRGGFRCRRALAAAGCELRALLPDLHRHPGVERLRQPQPLCTRRLSAVHAVGALRPASRPRSRADHRVQRVPRRAHNRFRQLGFRRLNLRRQVACKEKEQPVSYENYERWKKTPVSGEPFLSIVIPAYNEEVRIIPTIGAIASHVSDLGFPWELLIADDGSKDSTVKLTQELGFANLRVLIAERNGGKGSAVRRGMLAARGKYVLFADADNSTPIEEVTRLIAKLDQEGYDVAVGSRAAEGASEGKKSLLRHILSGGLRTIVRYGLRIKVRDTQCGFKMYTRTAAQKLHTAQTINGFSFDLEVLYLAFKLGYKVAEVPVSWIDAPGSKVDARKEVKRFVKDIFRILSNDVKGVYAQRLAADAPSDSVHVPA
ncbi:MAG: glycosyltransferase family 2 protein [Chloroflexi bacterium]|nr:glycosyltransferase family 2 protein [Chloroflexota bacterium]